MPLGRDRLISVLVVVVIAVTGLVTLVLLNDARSSGLDALRKLQSSEVAATARSFNQRQLGQISGAQTFLQGQDYDLTLGGDDQAKLDELYDTLKDLGLQAGFFLVDRDGVITAGVLIPNRDEVVGTVYDRPGFDDLVDRDGFRAGILPAGDGLTTNLPTTATVYAVTGDSEDPESEVIGYFVIESPLTVDASINQEIGQLADTDTEVWRFVDSAGNVVASSEPGELATPLPESSYLELDEGLHNVGDKVVVIAPVPATGWKVIFSQDTDEFEGALAGPLQDVGLILVIVLVGLAVLVAALLARQLRAAREEERRLRRLNETQEEFISIVSHELRTPVAGVLGFLQTGLDHWDSLSEDERKHTMSRASASARRLHALTRDVLDTQSVEAGSLSYAFDDLDLRDEITSAVTAARSVHDQRPFEVTVPTEPVTVHADADRLQQVLTNLLDNADNNSPPDLPVHLSLEVDDGRATVVVRDHGPGVDEDAAERIFDKFVRGRANTVAGTGLGLYVSRQIVDAHHGRIWVENEPEGGARFAFELPLVGR